MALPIVILVFVLIVAFAFGICLRRAVPQLRKLKRTDRELCPGWYVREEAEDAIERIAGRPGQEREPVHMRTQQNDEPKASTSTPKLR